MRLRAAIGLGLLVLWFVISAIGAVMAKRAIDATLDDDHKD
jgi:hypothetical protein